MIDLALTPTKRAQLMRLLRTAHSIRVVIQLQTLSGNYVKDLTPYLQAGQVNVRYGEQVTRAVDLTLFDPFQRIQLDPDDPTRTSVGMADLIRITYVVQDPETKESFNIPIFCGPVDDVSRDRISLKVTCVGKESLAIDNSYVGKIYKKGAKKTDVIKHILRYIMGETNYQIPNLSARLPADWRLSQGMIPWDSAKALARGMGYQLFYDGRGVCRMRIPPRKALHTFNDYWVTDTPEIGYSTDGIINTVIVKGGKPKKAKTNASYTAIAPAAHPLSPARLGRNGVPRYLYTVVEDSSLKSVAACKTRALQVLSRGLLMGFDAQWDALPLPLLEEGDVVHIDSSGLNATVVLTEFSIPLTIGSGSYGYSRTVGVRGGSPGISGQQYRSYQKQAQKWSKQIRKSDKRKKRKHPKHR